ncbi:hypothetical protein IQ07DRAFT_392068 [Pyrenochaeta sp. DS3sAY3a]|nr:hypothetical protein IQ07DRAFT_392068 [Pyrenochaeta sp. DS3sAY3a]
MFCSRCGAESSGSVVGDAAENQSCSARQAGRPQLRGLTETGEPRTPRRAVWDSVAFARTACPMPLVWSGWLAAVQSRQCKASKTASAMGAAGGGLRRQGFDVAAKTGRRELAANGSGQVGTRLEVGGGWMVDCSS